MGNPLLNYSWKRHISLGKNDTMLDAIGYFNIDHELV
jgi:hypothetical protein